LGIAEKRKTTQQLKKRGQEASWEQELKKEVMAELGKDAPNSLIIDESWEERIKREIEEELKN